MSCGVARRCGLELVLLWLWHRPVATALIHPLAWEPPHAGGAALEKAKKKKKGSVKEREEMCVLGGVGLGRVARASDFGLD